MGNTTLFESIVAFVKSLTKGSFGICVETQTIPTMNKTGNPFVGRVVKRTRYANIAIGYDYENTVNARLLREGKPATFRSQTPKGMHWAEGLKSLFLQADKNADQYYLRLTFMANTKPTSDYLVDGREATPEEVKEFSAFFPEKTSNASHQGLSEEHEVRVVNPKIENIVRIYQSEDKRLWTRP